MVTLKRVYTEIIVHNHKFYMHFENHFGVFFRKNEYLLHILRLVHAEIYKEIIAKGFFCQQEKSGKLFFDDSKA